MDPSARKSRAKLFCLCRRPQMGLPMIQCDKCEEWFHFACVGLPEDTVADAEGATYLCPPCTNAPASTPSTMQETSAPMQIPGAEFSQDFTSQSLPVCLHPGSASFANTPPDWSKVTKATKRAKAHDSSTTENDDAHVDLRNLTMSPASTTSTRPRRQAKPTSFSLTTRIEGSSRRRSATYTDEDDDDDDDEHSSKHGDETRRYFHNHRERIRRTTIRNLFDNLRRSVPAVEKYEGISDRQILIEAAHHIEELNEQDQQLEESIAQLKVENLALQVDQTRLRVAQRKNNLAAIADAAMLATLETELTEAREHVKMLLERPRIVRTIDEEDPLDAEPAETAGAAQHRPRPNSTSSESTGNTTQHVTPGEIFHMSMMDSPADPKQRLATVKAEPEAIVFGSLLSVATLALEHLPPRQQLPE